MLKKSLQFLFFIFISSLALVWYGRAEEQKIAQENYKQVLGTKVTAPVLHSGYEYNWELYHQGLASVQKAPPTPLQSAVVGGIVPHHLLQSSYIADLYARFAQQRGVETVIVIGPNHTEAGSFWSLTSSGSWETPDGVVEANTAVIEKLKNAGVAREDDTSVRVEHSINSQLPFISHYLPGAKVVPVVLSIYTTQAEVENLVTALQEVMDEHMVVVGSVDFSHFHDSATAQQNDLKTRKMLESRSYGQIFSLARNADYFDSPASIVSVMQLMDKVGASAMNILGNTNSGILLQDDSIPTTSYFEIAFTR